MPEADWVELSLAGDLDTAARVQYRQSIEARTNMPTVKEPEDFLPIKRVPAALCPGFERLDAIMSIPAEEPEKDLVDYKPVWSGVWGMARVNLMENLATDAQESTNPLPPWA